MRLRHSNERRWLTYLIWAFALALAASGCRKPTTNTAPSPDSRNPVDETVDEAVVTGSVIHTSPYVGSQSCQSCHAEISKSYAQHSMGRSATALTADTSVPAAQSSQFEANGFRYEMKQHGGEWVHHQGRITAHGETAEIELPVSHLIGSGKNGQSFLVNRSGYLFMSPMTWYPAKSVWDLSPGYETKNSQFNRPVVEQCLYCHTDGAHAVHSSMNQFKDPILRAHAIGCERCHGPGKAHVEAMQSASPRDPQIVNPRKLSPDLREAVCQQCHLSGVARVLKPNRTLNDFIPGEPLDSAYTIFTLQEDGKNFVGHVEQMHQSACYKGSSGELGCISCHDPHSLPAAADKVSFYRNRCIGCHENDKGCSLASENRLELSPDDNCVECHMPRMATEIRHAAVTDHSVPRIPTPESRTARLESDQPPSSTAKQLLAFPAPSTADPRDKAIALVRTSVRHPELLGAATFDAVLSTLERVVQKNPTDLDASDALAELYLADKRVEDALQICQRALEASPQHEATLLIVSEIYMRTGRHQLAASAWEKAIGVNPWMSKYWYSLGQTYAALQRWARCKQLATEGKKRFPTSMGLRHLLVECHLQLGDTEAAEVEFQEIVDFHPDKLDTLKEWFRSHPSRK